MCFAFLKVWFVLLTCGTVFFPVIVNGASQTRASFQMLPFKEQQNVLQILSHPSTILTNGIETRISDLSTVYHIPMQIIRALERLSRLQIDRLDLTTAQGQYVALKEINVLPDPGKLDQKTWSYQMNVLQNPNQSSYRERERGTVIRILGEIGKSQKLPPDIVYYLRNLMFEMENPNIRVHVVNAFRSIISLHHPDSQTMGRLASWMRKLREGNRRISILRDLHFKSWNQKEKAGYSLPDIVGETGPPPQWIGSPSENSQIYGIVEEIAQKHFIPEAIVRELDLALEGNENELPGTNGIIILADNLLNALFAVAQRQRLPSDIVSRLEELNTEKKYSSNDQVTIDEILMAQSRCKGNFL